MIQCPICGKEGVEVGNPKMIEDEVVQAEAFYHKCKYIFSVTFSDEGIQVEG